VSPQVRRVSEGCQPLRSPRALSARSCLTQREHGGGVAPCGSRLVKRLVIPADALLSGPSPGNGRVHLPGCNEVGVGLGVGVGVRRDEVGKEVGLHSASPTAGAQGADACPDRGWTLPGHDPDGVHPLSALCPPSVRAGVRGADRGISPVSRASREQTGETARPRARAGQPPQVKATSHPVSALRDPRPLLLERSGPCSPPAAEAVATAPRRRRARPRVSARRARSLGAFTDAHRWRQLALSETSSWRSVRPVLAVS